MKKIFFCRNTNASWAIRDREILSREHDVFDFFVASPKTYLGGHWFFQLLTSDIIFCWFASFAFYPAVILGKMLGKKIIVVSGGFDAAAAFPINYGAFTKGRLKCYLRRKLFFLADKVLCVSKANMYETIINAKVSAESCELIYHGFEPLPEDVKLRPWEERKDQVVMISQCDRSTFYRKGIDQFIKLASQMPDFEFLLIGRIEKGLEGLLQNSLPDNLKITGFLPFREKAFNTLLNESKFIVQLSQYESFGCSVIDGSIMGCYPITFNNFSLFEVVASIGKSCVYGNLNELEDILRVQSANHQDVGEISSKSLRIFSLNKRVHSLLKALKFA